MKRDMLLILDFGGTQAQDLARRLRGCQIYCELRPFDLSADEIAGIAPRGLILAGACEDDGAACDAAVFSMGLPVLGIGHGARCMVRQLGGQVRHTALEDQTLQLHFAAF